MSKQWDPSFTPYYTPLEMLEMGVFEGKYINALTGLPASWYKVKRVVGPKDPPDVTLNHYGVKSRQPLSEWRKNGWLTKGSPFGWFEWYCHYYLGRRIPEEDSWQIGRWRSFVARHQGQIIKAGVLKDETKHLKQRQALLQWAWRSTLPFNERNQKQALAKMLKSTGLKPAMESNAQWFDW